MKKIALALGLIAAAAAGGFAAHRIFQRPIVSRAGLKPMPLVREKQGTPASLVSENEKPTPAPIQVRFQPKGPFGPAQAGPVTILVEAGPGAPSNGFAGEGPLELLLRLPSGVRLESPDWQEVSPTPEEKQDPSGPWKVYEKKNEITVPEKGILSQEEVSLAVVEEGVNWVVTVRARLTEGSLSWQAFGVMFASLQDGLAEFYASPKTPQINPQVSQKENAQENRP